MFCSTYVLRLRCFCYIDTFPLHVIFGAAYENVGLTALALLGAVGQQWSRDITDWLKFSCGIAHSGKGLTSVFQEFSASINEAFILAGGISLKLFGNSCGNETTHKYMFIGNNRPSFNLWWKENLVKHWKVSKYYESDWGPDEIYWILLAKC